MKTLIWSIVVLAFLFYTSEPTINFKPFSISFEKPYIPFAILFFVISMVLYTIQVDRNAYKRGVENTEDVIIELLNKKED